MGRNISCIEIHSVFPQTLTLEIGNLPSPPHTLASNSKIRVLEISPKKASISEKCTSQKTHLHWMDTSQFGSDLAQRICS